MGSVDYRFERTIQDGREVFSDIFLSQDAIDAFLKEDQPQSRYEKFMQGFGWEEDRYRSSLYIIKKQVLEREDELSVSLESLKTKLGAPVNPSLLDVINSAIEEVNDVDNPLRKVGEGFSEEDEVWLKSSITKRKAIASAKIADSEKEMLRFESLILQFPEFKSANSHRKELLDERSGVLSLIAMERECAVQDGKLKGVAERLEYTIKKKKIHADYVGRLEQYVEHVIFLDKLHIEVQVSELSLSAIRAEIDQLVSVVSGHESTLSGIEQSGKDLEGLRAKTSLYFEEMYEAKHNIQLLEAEMLLLSEEHEELSRVQGAFDVKLADLESFEFESSLDSVEQLFRVGLDEDLIGRYSDLWLNNKSMLAELDNINVRLGELAQHATLVGKVVEVGIEILNGSKSDSCPLCSSKFDSYEKLIASVGDNKLLDTLERELLSEKVIVQQNLEALSVALSEVIARLKIDYQGHLAKASLDAAQNKAMAEDVAEKLSVKQNLVQRLSIEVALKSKAVLNMDADSFAQYLSSQQKVLEQSRATIITVLSDFRNLLMEKRKLVATCEAKVELKYGEIELAKVNEFYADYLQYLVSNNVEPSIGEQLVEGINKVGNAFDEDIQKNSADVEFIEGVRSKLLELIEAAGGWPGQQAVDTKLENVEYDLKKVNEVWLAYSAQVKSHLQLEEVNVDSLEGELNSALQSSRNNRDKLARIFNGLAFLLEQVEYLKPFFERPKLLKEYESSKQNLLKVKKLKLDLEQEYSLVVSRLKAKISNFFYSDLINKLYSKIDPHPNFKEVDFRPVFPENDKPRLEVYLRDDENNLISPTFYFSSAQLNILSLSIFLARALHARYQGEAVDSIFIDDPIHSMDSINVLSVVDLLRNISVVLGKQLIMSTHDEKFHLLLQKKIPTEIYGSKFIGFETYGKISAVKRGLPTAGELWVDDKS